MTLWTLIFRSLRFHARSHLGTLLGAIVGSAVLTGALVVGDSVRGSLREIALNRLGKIDSALMGGDRFFRAQLADEMATELRSDTAPALQVLGTVSTDDNSARANKVQVVGVDKRFWKLAVTPPEFKNANENSVVLNSQLAAHLNAKVGDTILLRVQKPSLLSREAPISPQEDFSAVFRMKIGAVVSDQELGRFSLQANQVAPFNAFIPLNFLQKKLEREGKANLLLLSSTETNLNTVLQKKWQLADAELELRSSPSNRELRSPRIFLDDAVIAAAAESISNAAPILTYFVNELRVGTNTTPYSMVTAARDTLVPTDLEEDEIVINEWLAEDLQAKPGDELTLRYFTVGTSQRLEEKTNLFRIHSIVPLAGIYADRDLMPEFPGISKAEKTENWDAGFDIDMGKIRPKDELYWKNYRGTPKAFIGVKTGEKMWTNRFGSLTAIRFQPAAGLSQTQIEAALLANLNPASLGLIFQPVREQALAASAQSQDFGGLFLGFSFFLIIAALLLMALLFQFGLEQRVTETGTLIALGFTAKKIRNILLLEGTVIAMLGGIIGVIGGVYYAKGLLHGLITIWKNAVGSASLSFHVTPVTLIIGFGASVMVSLLVIWLVLRKQAKQSPRELLDGVPEFQLNAAKVSQRSWSKWIFWICGLGAIGLGVPAIFKKENVSAETFFSGGMLLLIAGLAGVAWLLKKFGNSNAADNLSVAGMGMRNATRRRKRTLATVALLACGTFLIASIGAFKLDETASSEKRSFGTGGFALIGETAFPVVQNLKEKSGLEFFGLDEKQLTNVSFVPIRVHEGDDASCLNLNRAQRPRLLGVNPIELDKRGAFTFTKIADGVSGKNPWLALSQTLAEDEIAAIGDEASILWALGKKVDDTLDYEDGRGNKIKIRIIGSVANSILQGSLLIDEQAFMKHFPGDSGYRMFLIDAPSANVSQVSQTLSRALRDIGLDLTPTRERLAAFNAVQNTYLNTFQVLGGLGLLLGSVGLGIVVLRNVLERRGELALLSAVGFRPQTLRWLVLSEHAALLVIGLLVGIFSALLVILPMLLSPAGELPPRSLGIMLGAILLSGLLWTWVATRIALRGELLKALRNE